MTVNYEYSKPEITYPKKSVTPVDAIYHKVDGYEGNPFVEALPFFSAERKGVIEAFTYDLREEGFEPSGAEASLDTKLAEIEKLRQLVFPLPCYQKLAIRWNKAIRESLRIRWENFHIVDYPVTIANQNAQQHGVIRQCVNNDGDVGIVLTGPSGSGKNTAIRSLLDNIPRIIVHHFVTGQFIQIVWLFVTTPNGGSLQDLYLAIAVAIDNLLDNMDGFYANEVNRIRSVDGKASYIIKLIQRFGIGALIIDEVQNMNFTKNAGSSFRSLTKIENETKIPIISLGLESAIDKLYSESYTARRAGHHISTVEFESELEENWFRTSIGGILEYQWSNKHVEVTDELIDTILDVSGNVIDDVVQIWMDVQTACVNDHSGKLIPTPELIRKAAKPYERVKALRDAEKVDADFKNNNTDDYTTIANKLPTTVKPISARKPVPVNETMLENVMSAAKYVLKFTKTKGEYTDNMIKEAAEYVMQRKGNENLDEDSLVGKTLDRLKKKTKTRKTNKMPVNSAVDITDTLQNYTDSTTPLF